MTTDTKPAEHTPPFELPLTADPDARLSDGTACWSISSPSQSIAEMMCSADIERAAAEYIVRAVNAHYPTQRVLDEMVMCFAQIPEHYWPNHVAARRARQAVEDAKTVLAAAEGKGEGK